MEITELPDREEVLRRRFIEVLEFVRAGSSPLPIIEAVEEAVAFDGVRRLAFIVV